MPAVYRAEKNPIPKDRASYLNESHQSNDETRPFDTCKPYASAACAAAKRAIGTRKGEQDT